MKKIFLITWIVGLLIMGAGCSENPNSTTAIPFTETPLASKLDVKDIQVNVPKGFNVVDGDLQARLDYPASYLDINKDNFLFTITNRVGETKVFYNNQEIYKGLIDDNSKPKVEAQMSPNGKYVGYLVNSRRERKIYTVSGKFVSSTEDWGKWLEVTNEREVRFVPAEQLMSASRCPDFELPKDIPGLTDGERKIPGGQMNKNCKDYLVHLSKENDPWNDRAVYDGKVVFTGYFVQGNLSENGKHYAFIAKDGKNRQDTLIVDGRTVMSAPYLIEVRVSNNGDSMVLAGKKYLDVHEHFGELVQETAPDIYRNGKLVATTDLDTNQQLPYDADPSGQAYIVYTSKEWILSDGTRITRIPEAQIRLDGTKVYHYYYSTSSTSTKN